MPRTEQVNQLDSYGAMIPKPGLKPAALYIYLNFMLLLLAKTFDLVIPHQLNWSQIFLGILTLIYLPFILLIILGKNNKINAMALFIIFIIAASPIFYLALDILDKTRSLDTHSETDKFISYASYSVHALAFLVCLSGLNTTVWNKVNKYIFYLGICISLEALLFNFIFPDIIPREMIAQNGKFGSLIIHNNVLCGIIATILYVQSIILFKLGARKSNIKFLCCGFLALVLLIAAGERSTILAFVIFNFLLALLEAKAKLKKPILSRYVFLLVIIIFGAAQQNIGRDASYFSSDSSIDRLVIASIGIKTAMDFLPFGAGGNMSTAYFNLSTPDNELLEAFLGSVSPETIDLYTSSLRRRANSETNRTSWHNTYIELIADLGIIGVVVCLTLVYYGCRYYYLLTTYLKKNNPSQKSMEPILWLCFYFFILITLFFASQNSYYWFFGFYLYGSLLIVKKCIHTKCAGCAA